MEKNVSVGIKRTLTGKGVTEVIGKFPDDLVIGKEYTLHYDFELKGYVVLGKYKAASFKWNRKI